MEPMLDLWSCQNVCDTLSVLLDNIYIRFGTKLYRQIVSSHLNIDNAYFGGMVIQIYPPELQLHKANALDTEAPLLVLHLSIPNGIVSSKIYER